MIEFKFPDIGEGISEGRLLKWFVTIGDKIKEGDSLFLVETDKVNAEIPSPESGTIAELMAKEGDNIYVGNVIVKIDTGSEKEKVDIKPINEKKEENAGVVGAIEVSSEVIEASSESYNNGSSINMKVLSTPVARKLAKDLGIDINSVKGTGPQGRVMKEDIYRVKEKVASANDYYNNAATEINVKEVSHTNGSQSHFNKEAESIHQRLGPGEIKVPIEIPMEIQQLKIGGEVERVPLTMLRKTIAKNMSLSKRVIPHAAVMDEFDVTKLVEFKKELKGTAEGKGVHLTYMPFIIKALTLALKQFPVFNSSFEEEKEEIVLKKFYNMGIAVDTPDGLLVPVIKAADRKGILEIGRELQELSDGARSKALSLEKLQNGTFTITNYGAIGASSGIPVIRYPEAAILGIGKIGKKAVVLENDEIVSRSIMNISLCIDHRIIDGGDAGRFLMCLREYLENPMLLMIS